uniref:Uncharacterized protein n=1 Tax=Kwoniella dejecticola CBS 10117 TaxID=1296121 RepID=A0A1A5ZZI7_9TREE|nr:uncharacterized protein I303_06780 [Kwoniella dejecticola CBS 10117]OBR83219.1 hypothetical protein I303_06780 [Kwoniella dejecticola CBS 10117]
MADSPLSSIAGSSCSRTPSKDEPHPDSSDVEADDEEDTSDDDQGVFLGSHQPDELNLIAKLSTSTIAASSSAIVRVKKRDSREFMRRKTLLLSPIAKRPIFSERQIRAEDYSDNSPSTSPSKPSKCSSSTPLKPQDTSDLTLDFSQFHLSSPRQAALVPEDSGSDKENVPVHPEQTRTIEEQGLDEIVVIGQGSSSEVSDDVLDMGGLHLSDFSDPETGIENSEALSHVLSGNEEDLGQAVLQSPGGERSSLGASAIAVPISPVDLLASGDTSILDSPLPVARAGPVVIPVLSSHHFDSIRAESGSPCRPLPPPIMPLLESSNDSLELPVASSPLSLPTARSGKGISTPSRVTLPPPELVEKGAKLLKESTSIKPVPAVPAKSAPRLLSIRSQLDNALSSRMGALGPPQRTVSSSSSSSSSATVGLPKPITSKAKTVGRPLNTAKPPIPVQVKRTTVPLASSTTKSLPRPALTAKKTIPLAAKTIAKPTSSAKPGVSTIPLKRPAPVIVSSRTANVTTQQPSRLAPVVPARPTLGQPSRNIHHYPPPLQSVPLFSVGIAGHVQTVGRPASRSPAKLGLQRKNLVDKGTPRKLGTPMRSGTPRHLTLSTPSTFTSAPPIHDVSAVPESSNSGPPATATRQATDETKPTSPEPVRGSSADHEEVSVQLARPPSSPVKSPSKSPAKSPSPKKQKRPVGRPRKIPPPQATTHVPTTAHPVTKDKPVKSAPPGISEKELKATTYRNTIRNQVYHCAIDRQIIRQSGPRPPSPTSKIRTTAERNEEEKKNAREARANRRKGQNNAEEEEKPVIEKFEQHRFPGDESDYETPRPVKKAKKEDKASKGVKFDKGLTVIRDDGSLRPPSRDEEKSAEEQKKGCLRTKVDLDHLGNLHQAHRPIDNLKRIRVVVNAVFYDGEEPVAFSYSPSNGTRSKKK